MGDAFQDFLKDLKQADYKEIRVSKDGIGLAFQIDVNCTISDHSVAISIPVAKYIVVRDDIPNYNIDKKYNLETEYRAIYNIKIPDLDFVVINLLKIYDHKIKCLDCGTEVIGNYTGAETFPPRDFPGSENMGDHQKFWQYACPNCDRTIIISEVAK